MGARGQAALAYLGQRYAERGGPVTPRDLAIAVDRYSDNPDEAELLERWLAPRLPGTRRRTSRRRKTTICRDDQG
jgi:hypothetical protein